MVRVWRGEVKARVLNAFFAGWAAASGKSLHLRLLIGMLRRFMNTIRKTLGFSLGPVVLCSLVLVMGCSLFRRGASADVGESETPAAVEQDSTGGTNVIAQQT